METRQVTIDDVTNMVYETALTFKGSTFGPVDFNRKFYGKFKCDVDHMIMALGNLKNCYNTETLLLLYGKNLITKKGKRQYSVEWLPTYEPSHYPRAEIEPENADYDIEIVEVKKRLPLDVSVAKPGSNELIDRSNSLSIPTSASSEKNRLDEITEAEVVKNSAVLENTIKTPTSISLQAPHDDVARAKDAPSKLSHCVLNIAPLHTAEVSEKYNVVPKPSESLMNIKTAPKNNIPKVAVAVSDTPILKEVPRKVPNDESAKKKKKALAKLSESYLNIKNVRDVNTPGDVGVIREITIPEDMRYKSAPISHYKNAVVPPVTRERMIAKSSPSSTPLDRVEATRSRSSQKNRAPAGSRQMMGPCPLVPVKHVPYHGPKRFEVTDPRLVLAKIEELLLNEQEDFVSADLLSCVYEKECRSQLLDDCKKAFKVSGYEALDSVPAFRGKIAIEVNMGIVFFRLLRRDFHERSSSRVRSPRRRRITPESSASSSSHEDWRGRRSHDRRHGRHSPDRRRHRRSPDRRSDSHLRSPRRSRYSTDSRSRSSRRQIYHSRRDLDNRRRTRSPARRSKSRSRRTSRSRSRSVRRYERSFVNTRSSSSRSSSPSPKIHNSSYSSEDSSRSLTHGEKADELKKRILDMFPNPPLICRRQAHVEIKPITFAAMQGQRL